MSTIISSLAQNPKLFFLASVGCLVVFLFIPWPGGLNSWSALTRENDAETLSGLRQRMVERDLRGRGIKDPRVLEALGSIPRHEFVPKALWSAAYEDRPLPIGNGQTISQPYVVALMTELLELRGKEKVLEIGTGSGYQAAVLAKTAERVYSIEIIPSLSERAGEVLTRLGFTNVGLKVGDGFYGWAEKAPFDAILLTAAAPRIPERLWNQLREGGRLVMPLGEEGKTQRLIRARKVKGKQLIEDLSAVLFVPLTGAIEREAR